MTCLQTLNSKLRNDVVCHLMWCVLQNSLTQNRNSHRALHIFPSFSIFSTSASLSLLIWLNIFKIWKDQKWLNKTKITRLQFGIMFYKIFAPQSWDCSTNFCVSQLGSHVIILITITRLLKYQKYFIFDCILERQSKFLIRTNIFMLFFLFGQSCNSTDSAE